MCNGKPYDLSEAEWAALSTEEKQRFFGEFRARLYTYWFRRAQRDNDSGSGDFRIDKTLK